eukprot:jgi/Bigna1/79832/fgenesh1_pg.65_\
MAKSTLKNGSDNVVSSNPCKSRRTYCYNIALSKEDADMVRTAGKEHHYLTFEWVNDDGLTEIYRLRCSLGLASNPQARRKAKPCKFKRKNTNTLELKPENTRLRISIRLTRHAGSLGGLWWRNSDDYFIELLPSREGRKQRSSLPWPLTVFELKTNHRIRVLRFERGNKVRVNFLIQKGYTKKNNDDRARFSQGTGKVEYLKQKITGIVQDMQNGNGAQRVAIAFLLSNPCFSNMFAKFRPRKRKTRYRGLLDEKGRSEQLVEASIRCEKERQQRNEEGYGEVRGEVSLTSLSRDRCSKKHKNVRGEPKIKTCSIEEIEVAMPLRATTSTSITPPPSASPSQIYIPKGSI